MHVAATDWNVSYRTSTTYEGAMLRVFLLVDDVPNEHGGMGVTVNHPELDGLMFETTDLARAAAQAAGLVRYQPRAEVDAVIAAAAARVDARREAALARRRGA